MFLEGKNEALLKTLKKKMEEASERLAFETAAKVRDQITHIEKVLERQKIVSRDFIDQDVIGLHRQDHTVVIHPLFIRAGKLLGGKGFAFPSTRIPEEEVLDSFLRQYYRRGKFIPDQVLIPIRVTDQTLLEEWLAELKGKKVRILVPERGEKKQLLDMACENAEKFLTTGAEIEKDRRQLLNALKEELHLARIPSRIEAFDISNIQGRYAVGSMVVFEHGEALNERYRHFRIKSIEGADDYGMMYEVLLRRYKKALEEDELPDLVLVDGGRGQLNVAQEVLKELNIRGVDLIGLAKERRAERSRLKGIMKSEEKVFHPQFKEPLILGKRSPLIHFLDQIRDEAHRFAITYHKKMRGKGTIRSALGEISEIGGIRQKELLRFFGSVEKIKDATLEELARVPKMNSKSAQRVYSFFHADKE